jgi:hypothetical protein
MGQDPKVPLEEGQPLPDTALALGGREHPGSRAVVEVKHGDARDDAALVVAEAE